MSADSEPLLNDRHVPVKLHRLCVVYACLAALAVCGCLLSADQLKLAKFGTLASPPKPLSPAPVEAQAPNITTALKYGLWWFAPFWARSGYGTEAINYIVPLLTTGRARPDDVWIAHAGDKFDSNYDSSMDPALRKILHDQELRHSTVRSNPSSKGQLHRPPIIVCHIFPTHYLKPNDDRPYDDNQGFPCPPPDMAAELAYRVAFTTFETDSLPWEVAEMCNSMDEVWVPTEFHRASFAMGGVLPEKLRVIRQGINTTMWDPELFKPQGLDALPGVQQITGQDHKRVGENFVFLSFVNWEARRDWDIVLSAFLREFRSQEFVELHIMTQLHQQIPPDVAQRVRDWIQDNAKWSPAQMRLGPRVFIHPQHSAEKHMPAVYLGSDTVVLPWRGDGWGRTVLEAMAMGLPVIATNWSSPTAFINRRVAYPLRVEGLVPTGQDGLYQGQKWAQPSIVHLQELMRMVVARPEKARAKGATARAHIQQFFEANMTAELLMQEVVRVDKIAA